MTSKLTRDIIQSEIADFFAGVVEIHTELGGPNTVEEAQNQLTERVLACVPAMDSEPVAWISQSNLDALSRGHDALVKSTDNVVQPVPLYRHAQQPVVPEGLRLALSNAGIAAPESDEMLAATQDKYIQALVSWVKDRKPFNPMPVAYSDFEGFWSSYTHPLAQDDELKGFAWDIWNVRGSNSQPAPVVPDDVQRDAKRWRALLGSARIRIIGSAGFDATAHPGENPDYRHFGMEIWTHYPNWLHEKNEYGIDTLTQYADAMLAAAPQLPGSDHATVPGKWIPVSERMPEDRISVILWDAEIGEVTSGHYSHKTQTFYHCGDAIENEITHWMPPPCAPQEVKGE